MSAPERVSDVWPAGDEPTANTLFALSRDLLCSLTIDGVFTRVGDACTRLTGFPPRELVGKPLLAFVHPLDRAVVERALARILVRGHADDVPTRFRTFAGGHVSLRWTAVADQAHGLVYAVARPMCHERERSARRRARAALKAAAAERTRLTSDLHDGLLQSLTGASLKLESGIRLLASDPVGARDVLERAAAVLFDEQRELRFMVEEMKQGWSERQLSVRPSLSERLTGFARRLHAVWDIELLTFITGLPELPRRLERPVFGIIHEALVNAARHGQATAATVQIDAQADHTLLRISDNGRGLSFIGRLDDPALRQRDQGPAVLKHRVWSLGGTLSIESRAQGVAVSIRIPFGEDA